jgi:cell division protease FtsH
MVMDFGMSSLGPINFGQAYDITDYRFGAENQSVSQSTLSKIDAEISKILNTAYQNAITILSKHRQELDAVSKGLIQDESMDQEQFEKIVGQKKQESQTEN